MRSFDLPAFASSRVPIDVCAPRMSLALQSALGEVSAFVAPQLVGWSDLIRNRPTSCLQLVATHGNLLDAKRREALEALGPLTPTIVVHSDEGPDRTWIGAVESVTETGISAECVIGLLGRSFLELVPEILVRGGLKSPQKRGLHALGTMCCLSPPPVSLAGAARLAGCGGATLNGRWRALSPRPTVRAVGFLASVGLIRAVEYHWALDSWDAAASRLGVHRRTLERYAIGLTGFTLAGLALVPPAVLTRQLLERTWSLPTHHGESVPDRRTSAR